MIEQPHNATKATAQDSRIRHLIDPEALQDKCLMVVGLGSLGFPAVQQLAMSGVNRWVLVDFDSYDEDNLVKHTAMRKDLGKLKVDIAKEWILDRRPTAEVTCLAINIATAEGQPKFEEALASCDVVLVTTDNKNSRLVANRVACDLRKQMVVSTVYRTGFGGEAFLYHPDSTGCFECLVAQSDAVSIERTVAEAKAATETEDAIEEARYGRIPDPKFGLSGLASDIASVAALAARFTLAALVDASVNANFLGAMNGNPGLLTRLENHMLALPYERRGGEQPASATQQTAWLDHHEGVRYGVVPRCSGCNSPLEEEVDVDFVRCCSWCGAIFNEAYAKEKNVAVTPIDAQWRPIPPPPMGHGINHVSIITRRHLIDDLDEMGVPNQRLRVAFQPFQMRTAYVGTAAGCPWCDEGEEQ